MSAKRSLALGRHLRPSLPPRYPSLTTPSVCPDPSPFSLQQARPAHLSGPYAHAHSADRTRGQGDEISGDTTRDRTASGRLLGENPTTLIGAPRVSPSMKAGF